MKHYLLIISVCAATMSTSELLGMRTVFKHSSALFRCAKRGFTRTPLLKHHKNPFDFFQLFSQEEINTFKKAYYTGDAGFHKFLVAYQQRLELAKMNETLSHILRALEKIANKGQ